MKIVKTLWLSLILLLVGAMASVSAQNAVTVGSQVTAEDQIVSGKAYLIKYTSMTGTPFIYDAGTTAPLQAPSTQNTPTTACAFYFISDGNGAFKLKNAYTGCYWPAPTGNERLYPTTAANAGSWAISISNGTATMTCTNGGTTYGLDRLSPDVVGWSSRKTVEIYEVEATDPATTTPYTEFVGKDVTVSGTAATSLATGTWYVMKNVGRNVYAYEKTDVHKLYNQSVAPGGLAVDNAQFLVCLVNGSAAGKYYIRNGLGNFFGAIPQNAAVPTTCLLEEEISITQIGDNAGYFYLRGTTDSRILDCQDPGYPVVGWGTDAPSATESNASWQFFPIELVKSWVPTISEVYTINNVNADRGAMMYNGESGYVWSSGKSASFDASSDNCRWVICPTGVDDQYYLYNVGAKKFAIPSGTASKASWIFSNDAVAIIFIRQGDGTYKIKTATTDTYAAVSNGFDGPIINYNDAGGNFTITKVDGADENTAATVALNKLMKNQTALSAVPTGEGWYAIRIKSGSYGNEFVYVPETGIAYSGRTYPLSFKNNVNKQPAIDNIAYLTHISKTSDGYAWQLPNGLYLSNSSSNYFPLVTTTTTENVQMEYSSGFKFSHNNGSKTEYAVAYYASNVYFIGESDKASNGTLFDIYPVNLDGTGLTAWKVTINGASESTQLTCNRSDVIGKTAVYNSGYFFLPTGTTPLGSDFSLTGMISCTVNAGDKTITAEYDPELSILASDVAVIQGNQTTGKGNTMQALLRIKATPFSDFLPTQFTINLSGADQVDNVAVYSTTVDQIHFAGVNPTLLGTTASPSDGTVNIDVTSASISAGTSLYYWITADIKNDATEWETIDASLTSISYTNAYKDANEMDATVLDLASMGNPDGEMRIYKGQSYPWTASQSQAQYYRIPTIINTADGGIIAFTDDRHNNSGDLGNHKIDVLAKKSMDGGLTWGDDQLIAEGDGTSDAAYGYGDIAVVRTNSGKLIGLLAAGKTSYPSGMLHTGYIESTDNGTTWSTVKDIYSSINKSGLELQSAFATAGKGVTFSNGRVAFAMNGKVSGTTNEYVIYSDDEGATWTISPTAAFKGADESKLEIMNDNSLLMSIRRGGWNTMANRGYNRTTGDASGDGVNTWGTQGVWGDETNANGCNADILYYNRETENPSRPDVILHTLTKNYQTHRKDLRLYMSFDQGATWMEAFQLQPGFAAYSSMQKLANGDLAIIFEDGSIGAQDKQDCFAINYLVLSKEILDSKIDELYESMVHPEVVFISQGETNGSSPWCSWTPSSGWATAFTSNSSSGLMGVEVSATYSAFNRQGGYDQRVLLFKPSQAGSANDVFTITAPDGYYITGYTVGGYFGTGSETYTLTADNGMSVAVDKNKSQQNPPSYLAVSGLKAKQTHITMSNSNSANTSSAFITHFVVNLSKDLSLHLNTIGSASYATLYLPFGITLPDDVTAYKIAVDGKWAKPTSMGQNLPALTPALLYSESGQTNVTAIVNEAASADTDGNVLAGTLTTQHVDGYVLNKDGDTPGFFKLSSGGTLAANRAYLPADVVSGNVKGILLNWGDVDGINLIDNGQLIIDNAVIYNMAGQRVQKPQRGIYIVNGKKIVVK